MVVALRPAQQMERDKSGDLVQTAVPRRPNLLEIRLRPGNDLEAVHRDKHQFVSSFRS